MLLFSGRELSITLVRMGISFSVSSLKNENKKARKERRIEFWLMQIFSMRAARGGFLNDEVTLFILVTFQIDKQN